MLGMNLSDQATTQLRSWNIDPDEWPAIHGQPAGSIITPKIESAIH